MALPFYNWSKTAASNATADATVNWAEGQAPSSVNDSARAMMASSAGFRDDISGAIVTGGTGAAYTVSSNQVFDTLAHLSGQMVAFTPNATNTGAVTLNVDGLGAKSLRSAPGVDLLAGTLIAGTPYIGLYNNSDGAFYLHGFFGNPYNAPIGGGMLYFGGSVPNSAFAFANGAAISRTTYASLFGLVGTAYGVGDGSTTFNIPDLSGRVPAGRESVASRLTGTYFGGSSTVLGAVGGLESATLSLAQLPTGITSNGANNISVTSTVSDVLRGGASDNFTSTAGSGQFDTLTKNTITSTNAAQAIAVTSNNTSGAAHNNVQPTFICNFIIRVL